MSTPVIYQLLAGDHSFIAYRPRLNKLTGSVTATILLQRILWRFERNGREPFYKFKEPCKHPAYRVGDSWCEELGFSRAEFDSARSTIAEKCRKKEKDEKLKERGIVYWTDGDRMTWYAVNPERIADALMSLYDEGFEGDDEPSSQARIVDIRRQAMKAAKEATPQEAQAVLRGYIENIYGIELPYSRVGAFKKWAGGPVKAMKLLFRYSASALEEGDPLAYIQAAEQRRWRGEEEFDLPDEPEHLEAYDRQAVKYYKSHGYDEDDFKGAGIDERGDRQFRYIDPDKLGE